MVKGHKGQQGGFNALEAEEDLWLKQDLSGSLAEGEKQIKRILDISTVGYDQARVGKPPVMIIPTQSLNMRFIYL